MNHAELLALLKASPELRESIDDAVKRGLESVAKPAPLRASQWADEHFYLSKESSYTEGRWKTWPFQRGILDCMGHDDIVSVTMRKPARVGYSKMLLAIVGYFSEHKRRNVLIYQPTDDDAEDWVKTELDTMLRDVPIMAKVFPTYLRRSKDNTLRTKAFTSSKTYIRGGKAAKNYRRHTVDVVLLDELSAFDRDVDKEGTPTKLSLKRLEGATFPKHIKGSTPRLRGFDLIDEEHDAAERQFLFHVPCPHCKHEQPLQWGGKNERAGFKWQKGKPETVVHMCARCGVGFTQAEYLSVWEAGRWMTSDGVWIDPECRFRTREGSEVAAPKSVAFSLWTAYSPQATWADIVAEYLEAITLKKRGDITALKTWTNTTKGESFKIEGTKTSADMLRARAKAETYRLRLVPRAALVLTCGVDVQDNRLHLNVYGFGREDETWLIDRRVMYCDPGNWKSWIALDTYLATRFPHEGGQYCAIDAVAIDTGGHFTHEVYRYAMLREARRVHATQGSSTYGRPIVAGAPTKQDVNVDGQVVRDGVKLWHVGTDTAKNLLHNRLRTVQPGPGYWHISHEVEDDYFDQLTAEVRVEQKTARGMVTRWVKPTSNTRNEDTDCAVLALFCAARMKLSQYTDAEWRQLEQVLCPPTADLFAPPVMHPLPLPAPPVSPAPPAPSGPSVRQSDSVGPEASDSSADPEEALVAPAVWAVPRGRRVRGALR